MKYKCYLPWRGELGWMLIHFVKKIHADPFANKIICCKPGHECLFPTATNFFYGWADIPDIEKAGVAPVTDENILSQKVREWLPNEEIEFESILDVGFHNKNDYASHTFIPISKHNLGLKTDVVITPRKREVDTHRNWTQENWQAVVDGLSSQGITVGVCGNRETSFDLSSVKHKSYDHIDIDSDVELMNNTKLVITQESGLQYLSFMCQKPTLCIDHYHQAHGADLHRNQDIPFKEIKYVWENPTLLVNEAATFLATGKMGTHDSSL